MERLTLILHEQCDVKSFMRLERSEARRVAALLYILPHLTDWTPANALARQLRVKKPALLWTLRALASAQRLEKETRFGPEIIATRPIVLVRKGRHNMRKNITKANYLRAPVYIKRP